jgi:putative inorganic carbon (hco3(-)) transporter
VSELARASGVVAVAGLALLLVATRRDLRLIGLLAWAAGMVGLAAYLAPSTSDAKLAAAAIGGAVLAGAGAAVLLRVPWLLAFATVACIPARIPVTLGHEDAKLLVPLYGVVAAYAVALAWQLLRGDDRARELGPLVWPLAAFVLWTGATLIWTNDVRKGAIFLGAFVLPFGLLSLGFARLPWRRRTLTWLWAAVAATALVYAAVGAYQWATRDIFWNPSVIVANAYAPFFRVNSIFWDPSIYGRYLVVAILATLPAILLGGVYGWKLAGLYAVVAGAWCGLFVSFSQSSFVALSAGLVVAAAVALGRRAVLGLVAVVLVVGLLSLAVPTLRHELVGRGHSKINRITGGRSNLVTEGVRIAADHPVAGIGVAGFRKAYAERKGVQGRNPKRVASHTTPVTVVAEEGVIGLALYGWLLAAALFAALVGRRRSRVAFAAGLVLVALAVQSVFYNAFFEDPITWAAFGLVALVAALPKPRVGDAAQVEERPSLERVTVD